MGNLFLARGGVFEAACPEEGIEEVYYWVYRSKGSSTGYQIADGIEKAATWKTRLGAEGAIQKTKNKDLTVIEMTEEELASAIAKEIRRGDKIRFDASKRMILGWKEDNREGREVHWEICEHLLELKSGSLVRVYPKMSVFFELHFVESVNEFSFRVAGNEYYRLTGEQLPLSSKWQGYALPDIPAIHDLMVYRTIKSFADSAYAFPLDTSEKYQIAQILSKARQRIDSEPHQLNLS